MTLAGLKVQPSGRYRSKIGIARLLILPLSHKGTGDNSWQYDLNEKEVSL